MSGDKSQQVVISTKEKMRVTFTSDAKINMKGFKASAIAFNKTGCSAGKQHINLTDIKLTTITSPNYYENKTYSSNSFCEWIFIAPPGEKVSFTMLEMETEYGYDIVKIYNDNGDDDGKDPCLATMSGNKSQQVVISTTEKMRVTFKSDVNKNMKGFKASVSAFRKADIPKLEWIDLANLNIKFPNGVIETIQLIQISSVETACIFKGKTNSTKVVITSKYSTSDKCQSLDQHMEISIISNNLKPNKAIYELKNGQLTQVDETIFEDNVVKGKRNVTNVGAENEELQKLIQIPIQFGYDRGLFNKFSHYGQGKMYIEKRIEEIFYHSKWSLQGMLKESNIELLLVKNIIFVNEVLSIDNKNLQNCRKYQRSEEVPIVILVEEDYNNNIKGLSFRSGACRKDNERYGVALISWRDDGSLAGDVLAHELGHLIGGIHNAVNETSDPEHDVINDKGEMHVGYSDFNYESVKFWFSSNGYRCFGKNCSSPPETPHGHWKCDGAYQSCDLKCDNGFSSIFSNIKCENGNWSDSINLAGCSPSVLFMAGGDPSGKDVEIYSEHDMTCSNKPPALDLVWEDHSSFYHQGTVYLCGGREDTSNKCISINSKLNAWRSHTLHSAIANPFSVVMRNILYLIGNNDIVSTTLPLTDTPDWSPVPTFSYKAINICVAKIDQENFVILGGYDDDGSTLRNATKYNVVSKTTQPLAFMNHARRNPGCIAVEESGKMWIVATGGYDTGTHTSAEKLDTSVEGGQWQNLQGDLNVARSNHEMAVTEKGLVVVGGWTFLKSVELLDWESESWTLIEPIHKSRHSYGGLVEIPNHLFDCQFATKACSAPPEKENGTWTCDTGFSSCFLRCDHGFVAPYHTTVICNGGSWKNINEMECLPSVFMIGTEIYHPVIGQPTCSKSLPSTSSIFSMHTSFFYNDTIYLFGGYNTPSIFESINSQADRWETHSITLESTKYNYGHSSIVIQNTLYIIGGPNGAYASRSTALPLSSNNEWSYVPNLSYWVEYSCIIKLDDTSFVITGGNFGNNEAGVLKYNVRLYNTITLPSLSHKRYLHGCAAMLEEVGKQWIIIGGGLDGETLKTSQKLDVSSIGNSWINLGNLNVARRGFSMINTPRGIMALGGYTGSDTINSVELLDWTSTKWKEVEPSLASPKNRYGGALEIPASLLGCETLLITVPVWRLTNEAADCWSKCGGKRGSCPNFCGVGGFCCHKGHGGCPAGAAEASPNYSRCVKKIEDHSSKRSVHTKKRNSDCPIRPFKENSHWICDATNTRCSLICDPGFASLFTDTICTQGIWQDVNEMECLESVLLVAGGGGWRADGGGYEVRKDVEIFDINSDKGNATCSYKPPMLTLQWYRHSSFTHKGTLYLCGGDNTMSTCISINTQLNTKKIHTLVSQRHGHSSIVMRNKLYLIGGSESVWTMLPLTDTPVWTPVVNLTYLEGGPCVVKIDQDNFVVIGSRWENGVIKYNVVDETVEALPSMINPRSYHGCVVVEESNKTWIVVTGDYSCGEYMQEITCGDGEKLDISGGNKTWETIGRLNVYRYGHGMAATANGVIVIGGKNGSLMLNSVELLDWETGEWKLIEQSLTHPRYNFGGIMEIPAIWFGCPSQNITITGCSGEYEYNKAYDDGVLTEVPENGTCYSVCKNVTECVGWTWTEDMECYIIKTLVTLQPQEGSISGLKNSCKPKCYLVLGEEEEASTSTQYCEGENTVTGCLNMIYMEPSEFHEGDKGRIYVCYKLEVPDGRGDIEEKRFCDPIDPEDVDLICNPEPGIITLSTYQHINKHFYYGHLRPYFIWWRR